MNQKTFKVDDKLELVISDIQGKDYLVVSQRVLWMRHVKPDWSIQTEVIKLENDYALVKATVLNEKGFPIGTGHQDARVADLTPKLKSKFVSKAETSAIGRALAMAGFGTQFAAEDLDEDELLSDSPVEPRVPRGPSTKIPVLPIIGRTPSDETEDSINRQLAEASEEHQEAPIVDPSSAYKKVQAMRASVSGDYVIRTGYHKGKQLKSLNNDALDGSIKYLMNAENRKKYGPLKGPHLEDYNQIKAFLDTSIMQPKSAPVVGDDLTDEDIPF